MKSQVKMKLLPVCTISWHLLLHRHGHDKASVSEGDGDELLCSRPERRGSLSTPRSVPPEVLWLPGGTGDAVEVDDADSILSVGSARDCPVSWGSQKAVSEDWILVAAVANWIPVVTSEGWILDWTLVVVVVAGWILVVAVDVAGWILVVAVDVAG